MQSVRMEQHTTTDRTAVVTEERVRTFGPPAAFMLAAGLGALVFGLITTIAEASAGFAKAITLSTAVGPLSGKTVWGVASYLVALVVLSAVLWRRDPPARVVYWATGIGVAAGIVLTFPTFFDLFKG